MLMNPDRFNASLPAGYDGQFEWDFLQGAFGPSVMPMDFDGVIERHGRFLVFETKEEDAPIPYGQLRTLESAWKTGIFTIILLWGKTPATVSMASVWDEDGKKFDPHSVTAKDLHDYAAWWWETASAKPIPDTAWRLRSILDQRDVEIAELRQQLRDSRHKLDVLESYFTTGFKLVAPAPKPTIKALRQASLSAQMGMPL